MRRWGWPEEVDGAEGNYSVARRIKPKIADIIVYLGHREKDKQYTNRARHESEPNADLDKRGAPRNMRKVHATIIAITPYVRVS